MTFRVEGEKAVAVKLETGPNDGRFAEVLSGLEEGDMVIIYPPEQVADGVRVEM